jgi:cbb3-type cytochrome oxidase maturation protein
MPSLYLLIPIGLGVVFVAIGVFLWATSSGQFDGLDEQSTRLPDDEQP